MEIEKDINQRVWESVVHMIQEPTFLCQILPPLVLTLKGLKPIYSLFVIGVWVGALYLTQFILMERERQRKRFEKIEKRLEDLELTSMGLGVCVQKLRSKVENSLKKENENENEEE